MIQLRTITCNRKTNACRLDVNKLSLKQLCYERTRQIRSAKPGLLLECITEDRSTALFTTSHPFLLCLFSLCLLLLAQMYHLLRPEREPVDHIVACSSRQLHGK